MLHRTRRTTNTNTVPAPVGGWNARDSIADMPPEDAIVMNNWYPRTTDVMVRYGCSDWATGITGLVESVCAYTSSTASKLFAAAVGSIYDATTQGAVGAAVVTGLTNARLQHVNMTTAGGHYLMFVNGADKLHGYDGSSWWVDGDGTHNISGIDTALIANISVHMNRAWLVQKDTLTVWYLGIDSIAGAATAINMGGLFKLGGYLMAMGSWTIDSGSGMDDYAVFVTSRGECAVYKGYDPSSSTTWSLVGVYQVGAPIGRRCLTKYASDLIIIGQDGLMPLSKALLSSRVNNKVSLTDKIQTSISDAVTLWGANFGWQTICYPQANMLILNVPVSNAIEQYAMNTITGAWGRFTGWQATAWELFNERIFFGTSTKVCRAWDTHADSGANIVASCLQSFSRFGSENIKWFKEARPIFSTSSSALGIALGLSTDYSSIEPSVSIPTYGSSNSAVFGTAVFGTAIFGADLVMRRDWQTIGGVGYSAAIYVKAASNVAECHWSATTYQFEIGQGF
jgi:hypothetical protein